MQLRLQLDQAEELGMIATNPARELTSVAGKTDTPRRVQSAQKAQMVLDASLRHTSLHIYGGLPMVARLALYAGLRHEEICQAQLVMDRRKAH